MNKKIRVLIADDRTLVRKGMITFVANEPGIDIVGEVAYDIEVVEEGRSHKPDLILLEMIMPRQNGLETIEKIKREYPEASILVVTGFSEEQIVFPVIKTRAFGYLLKDSSPQQLLQSIYDVHNGESSLDPNIALKLIREHNQSSERPLTGYPLTERESLILKLVAQGLSDQEIANRLLISESTVGDHIDKILNKLQLANHTQAAIYALRQGIADPGKLAEFPSQLELVPVRSEDR